MPTSTTSPQRRRRLRRGAALLPLLLCLPAAPPAAAACVGNGTGTLQPLEQAGFRAPREAIARAAQMLKRPAAEGEDALRDAVLWAISSESHRQIGQLDAARTAARRGLEALPADAPAELRVRLQIAGAMALQGTPAAARGLAELDAAFAAADPRSKAAACVQRDRGWLRYDRGDIEGALTDLLSAYELLGVHGDQPQRMIAAGRLAAAYAAAREFDPAIALLEETIAYFERSGARARLATAYDRIGRARWSQRQYAAAQEAFEQMRFRAADIGDAVAMAYAEIRLCGLQVDRGLTARAAEHCEAARRGLAGRADFDPSEGRILAAYRGRLALAARDPVAALGHFDASLGGDPAGLSSDLRAQFRLWRSDALAALGRHPEAYADLQDYLARSREINAARTASQIAVLRARFATDRETEKAERLARENREQQQRFALEVERLERETQLRRVLSVIVLFAVALLAALAWQLRRNLAYRRRLQQLADADELTGLPNRRRILALATRALRDAASAGTPLTIALLDLDHFKQINDRYGHERGDEVLRAFASAARAALRAGDELGRYGGEEFLVVLPRTDIVTARVVVDGLRASVRGLAPAAASDPDGQTVSVTLSAGLATAMPADREIEELVRRADLALYRAKESGRDRIEILPVPA